ncbi:hypothetical protein L3X38_042066 [Prunus dulcis]|uniref:Uncharacterized protein n=1 Tax=Prunus dulcis TaxID=3755 RepID=A0AAD4YJY4_PRUDU|nr:hypothetical protein L3X38_042066 [Prunus dulcis]
MGSKPAMLVSDSERSLDSSNSQSVLGFPFFGRAGRLKEFFGPSFRSRRRATTKPLTGLNGKGWIVVFALLTSNQPINRPSKEPPLGLGSFTSSGSKMVRFPIVYIGPFISPWAGH